MLSSSVTAQAISRRPFTAETLVQSPKNPCVLCGE